MALRSEAEIQSAADEAGALQVNAEDNGSAVPGMTYEEGVYAALMWVLGHNDDDPTEV